jgi:hypothetical protein
VQERRERQTTAVDFQAFCGLHQAARGFNDCDGWEGFKMGLTRKQLITTAAAVAAGGLVTSSKANDGGGGTSPEIEGTWRFDNLPAPGGAAVSLQTFARGGVFLESTVLIGGTSAIPRTTSQGAWEKIGPHTYLKTFEWFVQRSSGEVVRVRALEEVLLSGDLLTITKSMLTRYNLDGTFHSDTPCVSLGAIGVRLRAEELPCS